MDAHDDKTARTWQQRRAAILDHLRENGRGSVGDMAGRLKTTPQTIRKDLSRLASEGEVMRFHGGATLIAGSEYLRYDLRKSIAPEQKERIGRACAAQVPNNAFLAINSGTTTAAAARHLRFHTGLRVVVDSLIVANETRGFPGLEVIVPGGVVRETDGSILGEAAVEFLSRLRPDIALVGAAAVGSDGTLFDFDLGESHMVRTMLQNAAHVILAIDRSKFGQVAPVATGTMAQIQTLVIDRPCPEPLRQLTRAHSVRLIEV